VIKRQPYLYTPYSSSLNKKMHELLKIASAACLETSCRTSIARLRTSINRMMYSVTGSSNHVLRYATLAVRAYRFASRDASLASKFVNYVSKKCIEPIRVEVLKMQKVAEENIAATDREYVVVMEATSKAESELKRHQKELKRLEDERNGIDETVALYEREKAEANHALEKLKKTDEKYEKSRKDILSAKATYCDRKIKKALAEYNKAIRNADDLVRKNALACQMLIKEEKSLQGQISKKKQEESDRTFECTFEQGDGEGEGKEEIGEQTGQECIDACVKRRRTHPDTNGVTTKKNEPGCWCLTNMHTISNDLYSYDPYYKTCYLKDTDTSKRDTDTSIKDLEGKLKQVTSQRLEKCSPNLLQQEEAKKAMIKKPSSKCSHWQSQRELIKLNTKRESNKLKIDDQKYKIKRIEATIEEEKEKPRRYVRRTNFAKDMVKKSEETIMMLQRAEQSVQSVRDLLCVSKTIFQKLESEPDGVLSMYDLQGKTTEEVKQLLRNSGVKWIGYAMAVKEAINALKEAKQLHTQALIAASPSKAEVKSVMNGAEQTLEDTRQLVSNFRSEHDTECQV